MCSVEQIAPRDTPAAAATYRAHYAAALSVLVSLFRYRHNKCLTVPYRSFACHIVAVFLRLCTRFLFNHICVNRHDLGCFLPHFIHFEACLFVRPYTSNTVIVLACNKLPRENCMRNLLTTTTISLRSIYASDRLRHFNLTKTWLITKMFSKTNHTVISSYLITYWKSHFDG